MKVIMELSHKSQGDRSLIIKLINTGIASESILREKWEGFYESDLSFKKLCLILQAYCLIFPLKPCKPNGKVQQLSQPVEMEIETQSAPEPTAETSFLIPSMLPDHAEDPVDCGVPWVHFYFDFEKFLPETIYHRLLCIMLANAEDHYSDEAKFCKLWSCFYDIDESHWRFEFQHIHHRLKVSVG